LDTVWIILSEKERGKGELRDREEGDKEDVGWEERKRQGERETDQIEWRTVLQRDREKSNKSSGFIGHRRCNPIGA